MGYQDSTATQNGRWRFDRAAGSIEGWLVELTLGVESLDGSAGRSKWETVGVLIVALTMVPPVRMLDKLSCHSAVTHDYETTILDAVGLMSIPGFCGE